jgi:hypothetical protein
VVHKELESIVKMKRDDYSEYIRFYFPVDDIKIHFYKKMELELPHYVSEATKSAETLVNLCSTEQTKKFVEQFPNLAENLVEQLTYFIKEGKEDLASQLLVLYSTDKFYDFLKDVEEETEGVMGLIEERIKETQAIEQVKEMIDLAIRLK